MESFKTKMPKINSAGWSKGCKQQYKQTQASHLQHHIPKNEGNFDQEYEKKKTKESLIEYEKWRKFWCKL